MASKCITKPGSIGLMLNDVLTFDKLSVAEHFNYFFTSIAANLVDKLPVGSGRFGWSYITKFYSDFNVTPNGFGLSNVTEEKVCKLLKNTNACNATALDDPPARLIKDGAVQLAKPLTHVINLSLSNAKVPEELKSARVVPLHKKGSKSNVGNYRPVSILSIVSKIVERAVFNQLNDYIVENNLLYELQSGVRPSYSTDTCLIHLYDYVKQESDKGLYTGMVMSDLQKAFDTVNHKILLSKLSALGVNNVSVDWFKSYLSDHLIN